MNAYKTDGIFDLYKSVDAATAKLQTATCNRIIDILEEMPGMILGDDVGMGKTYIAFSTAAYFLKQYPRKKIVIITSNWLLNEKWLLDIRNFIEKNLNQSVLKLKDTDILAIKQYGEGSYLSQFNKAKDSKVILIPANVFASKCGQYEKVFYLCCWFKYRKMWEKTRIRILKSLGLPVFFLRPEECTDVCLNYEDISSKWYDEFDKIYEEYGLQNPEKYNQLLEEIRHWALGKVMPKVSLFILDEAHKMKNEDTLRRRSMMSVMDKKFEKAIFLTATPFQLGDEELKSVMHMFTRSTASADKIQAFESVVGKMFSELNDYKRLLSGFEYFVQLMSQDEELQFERLVNGEQIEVSSDVEDTYKQYLNLLDSRAKLEVTMRQLIIRNVKKKDIYRSEIVGSMDKNDSNGLQLTDSAFVPYALMEKAIYQIMEKGDRTFIANVKQTFTSSFAAVSKSSIMNNELEAISMLSALNLDRIPHPKVVSICKEAINKQKNGEKVLIFCNRIETMQELKKTLEKELVKSFNRDMKNLFEDSDKGFANYCKRFYSKYDVSWFLLQENYIYSVLVPILKVCGKNQRQIPSAKDIQDEVNKQYGKYNTTSKTNYMLVKRIAEQVVFRRVLSNIPDWEKKNSLTLVNTAKAVMNPLYIEFGLNLKLSEDEKMYSEDSDPEIRNIAETLKNVLEYKSIWTDYSDYLNVLEPAERDELVTLMIAFLRRDKRFFLELRKLQDKYEEKKGDYTFLIGKTFKKGGALDWSSAIKRFLQNYCDRGNTTANKENMRLGLSSKEAVALINARTTNDARDKIKAGFNTPFYPQILIVTATMQEGVDLQRECKDIIHYDMEWNPASMEQRVGRVDRIGSLISKLREDKNNEDTLNIYYPFIKNTIDESIYQTVKDREKWFNILLGGTPQWNTFEIDPDVTSLSSEIFKKLQINLGVS